VFSTHTWLSKVRRGRAAEGSGTGGSQGHLGAPEFPAGACARGGGRAPRRGRVAVSPIRATKASGAPGRAAEVNLGGGRLSVQARPAELRRSAPRGGPAAAAPPPTDLEGGPLLVKPGPEATAAGSRRRAPPRLGPGTAIQDPRVPGSGTPAVHAPDPRSFPQGGTGVQSLESICLTVVHSHCSGVDSWVSAVVHFGLKVSWCAVMTGRG